MSPEQLSEALRLESGLHLWCRRGIILTSFLSAVCMMIVALYQVGIVRHLIEPPLRIFNADKVDAAKEAYARMHLPMPDAFLGLISYAITAALAAIGEPQRWQRWSWLPLLLGLKVLVDAVQAGRLSWEQWSVHRAFCFWCLVAAAATFLAVPLALPESWAALRQLFGWTAGFRVSRG